jgi:peptidoglycan/LPS O-acetylase OafA/YrhL
VPVFVAEPLDTSLLALIRDAIFLFGSGTPMQNANAPVWSLRIEVICYGAAGLLGAAVSARPPLRPLAALLAAALLAAGAYRLDSAMLGYGAFAAGAAAAFLDRAPQGLLTSAGWACAAAAGAAAGAQVISGGPSVLAESLTYRMFEIAALVASALTVASIARGGPDGIRWPARLSFLSPFSYTLFITHVPLMALMLGVMALPETMTGRLAFAVALAFSAVGFAMFAAQFAEQHGALRRWLMAQRLLAPWLAPEKRP